MGPGALPRYPREGSEGSPTITDPQQIEALRQTRGNVPGASSRPPFRNAQDLFDYISKKMPKPKPGSLKPEEYWAIVTFILIGHGRTVPQGGVNSSNAPSISL
jgi:hypothetical protein